MRILKFTAAVLAIFFIATIGFVYLAPEKATRLALDAERQGAGLLRKQIDLSSELSFAYLEGGTGEPLILFHGFGGNKDNFTRVARSLTPHYRVIIPDLIGFGESSHPQQADYSPKTQAKNLHMLVQALGIKNVHLGGNSMGGHVALTYAALYPGEVKSLWLLDAAGVWSAPESELQKILKESENNPLLVKTEDDLARLMKFAMVDPPFVPTPMLGVIAQERIRNFDLEKRIFKEIKADSVEKRIAGMTTPSLIVWGEEDRALNVATADVLHKLLPNSKVILMPNVGHIPMLEQPKQSAEDYIGFRNSLIEQ